VTFIRESKEWHCTIRGPSGTEFEGGLYHFRILLPSEYPFRPPSILMLTPNGRFELNTKVYPFISQPPQPVHSFLSQICISFTNCTFYSRCQEFPPPSALTSRQITKSLGNLPGVFERVFHLQLSATQLSIDIHATAILGLQGFFPLRGKAALGVGGMDSPISDRKRLAALYVL
jgi:ubiquitin-conjugating enzyme E2 J1